MPRHTRNRYSSELRNRVLQAHDRGEDWRGLSQLLGINDRTVRRWVQRHEVDEEPNEVRGHRPTKLNDHHIDELVEWIGENPAVTLEELRLRAKMEFDIEVSKSSISRYLDGRLITLKKLHPVSETCNSLENKHKRINYVHLIQHYSELGLKLVWMDETNFNLHCTRTFGRAPMGERANLSLANSRGPNLHIIGAMDENSLVEFSLKRGSFKKTVCHEWVEQLLRRLIAVDTAGIVLICDNAPCHSQLEELFSRPEFTSCKLLRLGPYSPALNPIEGIWSVLKSDIKRRMRQGHAEMLAGSQVPGICKTEFRVRFLERIATESRQIVTPDHCRSMVRHVQSQYQRVLDFEDLRIQSSPRECFPALFRATSRTSTVLFRTTHSDFSVFELFFRYISMVGHI